MKTTILLFALISSFAVFAASTTDSNAVAQTNGTTGTTVKPVKYLPPVIKATSVYKYHSKDSLKEIHTGDYLMVTIDKADLDSAKRHFNNIRLWFNGICYPNMKPLFINESEPGIIFQIKRDTSANSPWQLMYTNPNYWKFEREVKVNLGTETTEYKSSSNKTKINLWTSWKGIPWVFYPLFILLLIVIVRYGKAFLKDISLYTSKGVIIGYTANSPTNAVTGVININEIPYSLSRFQFLIWLIVVFFGILHIWIITDVLSSPTGSTLLLLGISSGTFYISKLLDQPAPGNVQNGPAAVAAFQAGNQKSQGLFYDMLSDGKSISLHRLQLVMFTVFLATYFVLEVITTLIMPQFDETMLALMGISSATYAGIKTTEQ